MVDLSSLWDSFGNFITQILPKSPFKQFIVQFGDSEWIRYLNWFIPFKELAIIWGSFLGAIAVFYLAQIVLRWMKVIQG